MILEGIVTTLNAANELNVAPMGPHVQCDMDLFELKPFNTSTTFANLLSSQCGVLHVTDDVRLFVYPVVGEWLDIPTRVAEGVNGKIILNACRAFEFVVEFVDQSQPRAVVKCRTVKQHWIRDFFGFNRAKHAVVEAAILASRISLIPLPEIEQQLNRLAIIVEKTGGDDEKSSFAMLQEFVSHHQLA